VYLGTGLDLFTDLVVRDEPLLSSIVSFSSRIPRGGSNHVVRTVQCEGPAVGRDAHVDLFLWHAFRDIVVQGPVHIKVSVVALVNSICKQWRVVASFLLERSVNVVTHNVEEIYKPRKSRDVVAGVDGVLAYRHGLRQQKSRLSRAGRVIVHGTADFLHHQNVVVFVSGGTSTIGRVFPVVVQTIEIVFSKKTDDTFSKSLPVGVTSGDVGEGGGGHVPATHSQHDLQVWVGVLRLHDPLVHSFTPSCRLVVPLIGD